MKLIDSGYDKVIGSEYELHTTTLGDLRKTAKSWYSKGTDFSKFDNRSPRGSDEPNLVEMKKSGLISNFFFAYRSDKKHYLLDGFNRLFTEYGKTECDDTPVYIKILTSPLKDNQLMGVMFKLNMWKLQGGGHWNFKPDHFFDRGFRLFLYEKFSIDIYSYSEYLTRKRDFDVLKYFFRHEQSFCEAFAYSLDGLRLLMESENIVEDIREVLEANNYTKDEVPFKNFDMFVNGFAMFVSWRRVCGDQSEYNFKTWLDKLKADKKLFKKIPGMAGNESTRKNIYEFFRGEFKTKKDSTELAKTGEIKL